MPAHITTGKPSGPIMGWDIPTQLRELQNLFCDLVDKAEFAICSLDAGNVSEAGSVRADRIDTRAAKIVDAQIKNITADKLTAGTIDAEEIDVVNLDADNIVTGTLDSSVVTIRGAGGNNYMQIAGNLLEAFEAGVRRLKMGVDGGVFTFTLYNESGQPQLYLDSNGNAVFEGNVMGGKVISSVIEGFNDSGQKHGLWSNQGVMFADLELWYNGTRYFSVTNQIGSVQLSANGSAFLETRGANGTTIKGTWKSAGEPIATQDYVNKQIQSAMQEHIQLYHANNT